MFNKRVFNKIEQIADYYGLTSQADITIEECGELIQAICKLRRGWSEERYNNVREEVADVLIMVQQLRVILGSKYIDKIVEEKLDRQLERIAEEKGNDKCGENGEAVSL